MAIVVDIREFEGGDGHGCGAGSGFNGECSKGDEKDDAEGVTACL